MASPYDIAYERELRALLVQLVVHWAMDGRHAWDEFKDEVDDTNGWSNQGPFAYRFGWDQGKLVAAETRTRVAIMVQSELDPADEDAEQASAVDIVRHVESVLRGWVSSGLRSHSTSETSNLVERQIAEAADDIVSGRISDMWAIPQLKMRASFAARNSLIGTADDDVRNAKSTVKATQAKLARARTDASRDRINAEIRDQENAVAHYESVRDALAAAQGVPSDADDHDWT